MKRPKPTTDNSDLNEAIIKLRWGSQPRGGIKMSCYPYRVIAATVGRSPSYCREVALKYLESEQRNQRVPGVMSRRKRAETISKTKKTTDLNEVHF